jgi:hypothetical protein
MCYLIFLAGWLVVCSSNYWRLLGAFLLCSLTNATGIKITCLIILV